eukprot:scaffold489_cov202-Chaetoceros_neogracile.AAC.1
MFSSLRKSNHSANQKPPEVDEGFVNVAEMIDSAPNGGTPALSLKITPKNDAIGLDAPLTTTEFCVTVTASKLPDDDDTARAPVDIVVALDVSGSMSGRKLELCKDTLNLLLRELGAQDRFGLVVFGDEARLEIPTRKLTKASKNDALSKIKALHTRGCTNMSGGIGLAAQELQTVESPHEVRTIFLLTDGHANRGISQKDEIVKLAKGCLGATNERREIAIHCFGYGVDHDSEMLGDNPKQQKVDSDVSSAFGDALGGVLSVVAQNTSVKITVPNEASALGVSILHVKHDKAIKQLDGSYLVPIGDFYAEESRDVIVETTLLARRDPHATTTMPLISANLSYLDTINKKLVTLNKVTGFVTRPNDGTVSKTNEYVALQCIRIKATNIISETEAMAEGDNLVEARAKIQAFIEEVQIEATKLEVTSEPLIVQLLGELNTMLTGLASRETYGSVGGKFLKMKNTQCSRQRCFESSEMTTNMYRSSKKSAMSSKMKKNSLA